MSRAFSHPLPGSKTLNALLRSEPKPSLQAYPVGKLKFSFQISRKQNLTRSLERILSCNSFLT